MKCMKCGRETESDQAFCTDCLQDMNRYPVNPDVHVHLPVRTQTAAPRKQLIRRRTFTPEEQIHRLKKRLWILSGILAVTVALLCAMIYPTVKYFTRHYYLRPGQNYSTFTSETVAPTEN